MFVFNRKAQNQSLWRSDEAAILTGGKNTKVWEASGIAINVEEVKPGDLFFAAVGDNLPRVFERGAAAAVIPNTMDVREEWPCLKVVNTYEALRLFARSARYKTHALIISVQGEAGRSLIASALSSLCEVHEGGRHLSSGLAALPEHAKYGVFGFSPSVVPDIAIIIDCKKAAHSRVFQSMRMSGLVLMNEACEGFMECLAAVKASGLQRVMTFGELQAGGIRIAHHRTERRALEAIMPAISQIHGCKVRELDLLRYAAFKVKNVIDLGSARKTLVLDSAMGNNHEIQSVQNLGMPGQVEKISLLYTSRQVGMMPDMPGLLQKKEFENVAPEVLAPGDYMVFEKTPAQKSVRFSSAVRSIVSR